MADRYWVGGTASWDATAGTKWAATDGGAGGASVPTTSDDVFFTAASGAVTVTTGAIVNCANLNFTGFTGTFAGANAINWNGNLIAGSSMTWTHSGALTAIKSTTQLITCNGKTISPLTASGTGGVSIQDAFASSGTITVSQGTFTTNNFNVTATQLSSSNSNTRTINLGSSTVTLSAAGAAIFNASNSTGLTFNAGTSQINFTSVTTATLSGPTTGSPITFYNVAFTGIRTTSQLPGNSITGLNIFNNLAFVGPSAAAVVQTTFAAPQTINGTFSTSGTAGNRRLWFSGTPYGIAQTLTINSAPSLTDADFRDIYVIGTAAPISGTRIGDLRGCRGITFSTPKTVYWNLAAGGTWLDNAWAATSGGGVSTDNFPLAQDTAVIENTGLNTSGIVALSSTLPYTGSVDMSGRTNAMTMAINACSIFGNWINGSGTAFIGTNILTFSGRNTQTITSAGKTFSCPITIDTYGGTVELVDALNIGSQNLTVTNGTFDTKNYNVTAADLSSTNSNVRAINLGSSTVTLSNQLTFTTVTNFSFNAGTSSIILSASSPTFNGGGQNFHSVSFTSNSTAAGAAINGQNTFQNLTYTAPSSAGLRRDSYGANQTITGTLTCAGATAVRRILLRSDTLGTTRTLTVNSLSATDCDFRDITIAGAAAGSSPTRAGDCGGNTGITFPAPKTVYWNLSGTQNWSATAWATGSGGTPAVNNFPLAQDTAVFDNTGTVGTVTVQAAFNIGTLNMSGRTSACTIDWSNSSPVYYGSVLLGSGVTPGTTGAPTFAGRGTQTITSGGNTWSGAITIDSATGTVQLADALTLIAARTLTLTSGTFDAVTYNVTAGLFVIGNYVAPNLRTLKMGSGTWTLSGVGTVFNFGASSNLTLFKGTANIVLSDTSTSSRTFDGSGFSFNKLTIGGATGASTLTISGSNQFTELASTKTVAHTISLTAAQIFGAWTVSGTAGNVVTVTGTAALTIAGARVSGVNFLAMGTTAISTTSPGEFYAGANSTGTGAGVILTTAPAAVTRYWRGGTGTWDATTTTNWSASSGGAGGASVPTSADAVIFDSASNATAYTVTCTATQLRCGSLTMAGPLVGNVTWAGSAPIAMHDNVSLAATGITRTYTGDITFSGSAIGRTFTPNGNVLTSQINVNGVNCGWSLGGAANIGTLAVINGSFDTASYSFSVASIRSDVGHTRSISLGSSVLTLGATGSFPIDFGTTETNRANLTFSAGTSQINDPRTTGIVFNGNNQTFYNYSFTSTSTGTATINGVNTFNNLSVTGITAAGLKVISFTANQTINGTLTLSAGTNATTRTFLQSDTIGTTRTLTCAAVAALTDIDFRDITIAGAAAPVSGTRLGDCKGNSGITFDAAKNVYFVSTGSVNWSNSANWSNTSGGSASLVYFPLAQDTILFEATYPNTGSTVTLNGPYNIGTIDMSARTSNTMTLATGSTQPQIYGNWINGTGTTLTGTGVMTFAGRGSQAITSAGKTFTQPITVDSPGGSVTLQDAFVCSTNPLTLTRGTFDAVSYNVTFTGTGSGPYVASSNTNLRTLAFGSGTWTIAGSATVVSMLSTNITVTGTGTISLTGASAKVFAGGGISYSGITLDQGGAGILTITGNNTFANITNTYKATGATTIAMGTTTQTVSSFTASGEAGRVLTVQGTSASSPATLILTSGTVTTPDYLAITGVRAYSLTDTWYAGANSTNNGSLGWIFAAGVVATGYLGNFFAFF
jgi:hypothetical protein